MVYPGWGVLAGAEIWNNIRTVSYVENFMPTLGLKDCDNCPRLSEVLLDGPHYLSPAQDGAEWYDANLPVTNDFYGAYAVSVTGLQNSTRSARMTDLPRIGGIPSIPHDGPREVRVVLLLLGKNRTAVDYGLSWLRTALRGNECDLEGSGIVGDDFCYLFGCPPLPGDAPRPPLLPSPGLLPSPWVYPSGGVNAPTPEAIEALTQPLLRRLRRVVVIDGPTVVEEYAPSCGAMIRVEFVMSAGVPFVFGEPTLIVKRENNVNTFGAPGSQIINPTPPHRCQEDDEDWDCREMGNGQCGSLFLEDPECKRPPVPPKAPQSLSNQCYIPNPKYDRSHAFKIGRGVVRNFAEGVPRLVLGTGAQAVRQAQIRFYAAPIDQPFGELDFCGYCGEFIIGYIPPQSTMVIDGTDESINVIGPGGDVLSARHVVYGSGGGPFMWPSLTCGVPYYCVVDFQSGTNPLPVMGLWITAKEV